MKLFEMIIDGGNEVFKVTRPAKSIKALKEQYDGNGEFVRIKDVTTEHVIKLDEVYSALNNADFDETQRDIIISLIQGELETI